MLYFIFYTRRTVKGPFNGNWTGRKPDLRGKFYQALGCGMLKIHTTSTSYNGNCLQRINVRSFAVPLQAGFADLFFNANCKSYSTKQTSFFTAYWTFPLFHYQCTLSHGIHDCQKPSNEKL